MRRRKYKKDYIVSVKFKKKIKSFVISKYLSNHIENILASISIISVYYDIEKLNRNLFSGFCIPISRGSLIDFKKWIKKIDTY